jgi:hypothetical protein
MEQPSNPQQERQKVYDYCRLMLGDEMVDVELDLVHYQTALERTLAKFRQRSPNSVEESWMMLTLIQDQNDYILPNEVINVQSTFRRTLGSRTGSSSGVNFEPFNLAYTNTYLLNSTQLGGLATYYMYAVYQENVAKMFGGYIEHQWIPYSHTLRILQRPFSDGETVLLRTQNYRPDFSVINDIYAGQWIKDYTLANCKLMLGEARSKFASIAGPQGGSALNGSTMLQNGQAEVEKLDKELERLVAGGTGYYFIIG